jgi:hypothetical protein
MGKSACACGLAGLIKGMSVAEILEAIRRLPAAERRGLVEHIWQAWPKPKGVAAWKPLKAEIDALLGNADRLERAQHVLSNLQETGPAPAPAPITEAEPRAEEFPEEAPLKNTEIGKPFEEVLAEASKRFPTPP